MREERMALRNKNGNILISDVIFLVLALAFIAMLFVFVSRQSSNTLLIEESAAKEIALAIDAANPGTSITINMKKVLDKNEGIENPIIVNNKDNYVFVKLSEKSGYQYSFFNEKDVEIKAENGGYVNIIVR